LYDAINQHQTVNIRQISKNWSEQIAYYRFLENENVTISELVRSLSDHCEQQLEGRHVLALSDTSEINLQSHSRRLKPEGLGVVGNNKNVGFFIHPTLVLDAESGFPLGLSNVQFWIRDVNRPNKKQRKYQELPIEKKESYKWLASAERSQRCFRVGDAKLVTHIGDREADIYEEWATVPDENNHVLVRVRKDRRLLEPSESLYSKLAKQPCVGTYSMTVAAEPRIGRTAREALMTVRFTQVQIQRPKNLNTGDYPSSLSLYAVEVEEVNPPKGQEAVHWRLMTTHKIISIEQALQIVQWYRWRWRIEQLFATLKLAGLNIEATQLESVEAIQRLTVLALSVAVRTLQMVEGRENVDLSASVTFSPEQQDCLIDIEPTLQGKTKKQQNPYPRGSLPWAIWIIARLGGASGYSSQGLPGMPTLVKGLRRFESILQGWNLARNRLVYTP
jgi:Transposase DDE domain